MRFLACLLLATPALAQCVELDEALRKAAAADKPVALILNDGDAVGVELEASLAMEPAKKESASFVWTRGEPGDERLAKWSKGGVELVIMSGHGAELSRWPKAELKDGGPARLAEVLRMSKDRWDAARKEMVNACIAFESSLGGQNKDTMLAFAKKVTDLRDPRTMPALAKGLTGRSLKVREHVIQEAHNVHEALGQDMLTDWLRKNPEAPLADYAWKFVAPKADEKLLPMLKKDIEACGAEFRIAALGRVRDKTNIPFLIDLMSKYLPMATGPDTLAREKMRNDCIKALQALTGEKLEVWEHWKKWWRDEGKSFKFPE